MRFFARLTRILRELPPLALVLIAITAIYCAGLFVPAIAFAQAAATTAAPSASVLQSLDLAGSLEAALSLGAAVLMGVAGFVLNVLRKRFHINIDAETRAYLDDALTNGVHFAAGRLATYLGSADFSTIESKNALLDQAVKYVNALAPGAVRAFGLDDQKLALLVEARLSRLAGVLPNQNLVAAELAPHAEAASDAHDGAAVAPKPLPPVGAPAAPGSAAIAPPKV